MLGTLLQFSNRFDLSGVIKRHANGDVTVEHQIAMPGHFVHPVHGRFELNERVFQQWADNMQRDVDAGHQISITLGHPPKDKIDSAPAAGWFESIKVKNRLPYGVIRMLASTQEAIDRGEFRFYSPSFLTVAKDQDDKEIGSRIVGGGITNTPFLVGMPALPTTDKTTTLSSDIVAMLWKQQHGHAGLLMVPAHISLSNVADVPGGTMLALGAEEDVMPEHPLLKALGAENDEAALATITVAIAAKEVVDKMMGMEQEGLPTDPAARLEHIVGLAFPAAPPPGDDAAKKKKDEKEAADKKELSDKNSVLEGAVTNLTMALEAQKAIVTELADKSAATELTAVTERARSEGRQDKADVPWFVPGDEVKTLSQFKADPVWAGDLEKFKAHVARTQPRRTMKGAPETGKRVLLSGDPGDDDSPGGQWVAAYRGIMKVRADAGHPIKINEAIELAKVEHADVYETYLVEATSNPNA